MNWLKQLLNRWTETEAEIRLLESEKEKLLAKMHETWEVRLLAMLRAPDRWQPDQPLTTTDVADWAALLRTPLLAKIDLAMINMAQQEAQRAIHAEPADTIRAAGYAAGYRAAWSIAKALSTLPGAPTGKPEPDADTETPVLDHLSP